MTCAESYEKCGWELVRELLVLRDGGNSDCSELFGNRWLHGILEGASSTLMGTSDPRFHSLAIAVLKHLGTHRIFNEELGQRAQLVLDSWESVVAEVRGPAYAGVHIWSVQGLVARTPDQPSHLEGSLSLLRRIFAQSDGNACVIIEARNLNLAKLRQMLNTISLPPEPRWESLLEAAGVLAGEFTPGDAQRDPIGTDHLLLAILEGGDDFRASQLLTKLGLTAADVRPLVAGLPREPRDKGWSRDSYAEHLRREHGEM